MFAFQSGFRIIDQPDRATRDLLVAIGAGHQEVDLDGPLDGANQIAQENEASLE
jgi:hypothetical protein